MMLLPLAKMPPETPYRVVWRDEFARDGRPDPAIWRFEEGFVRNEELQFYREANARVEKGRLVIEARREALPNPGYEAGSKDWRRGRKAAEYTSACLVTRGKREFRFGRLEVRAKIDARKGLWPAIWTLGTVGPWPECGEVDQLEYYGDSILANAAWGSGNPTWDSEKIPYSSFPKGWDQRFHVWRMDWDAAYIRIYLDGKLLNETDLGKTINPDGSNPFHNPQYLLLNLAVGSNGGDPGETEFPSRFEVDYVRVYQKAG